MPYDPTRHHRRSIRLEGYDYTQPGAYFITLCVQNRECLFGAVVEGEMRLNEWGEIAREEWFTTARLRPYVRLDEREFVVMPNHVHGIIWIVDDDDAGDNVGGNAMVGAQNTVTVTVVVGVVGAQRRCAPTVTAPTTTIQSINVTPGSLGAIIRAFKSAATRRINAARGTPGADVWQRNYYERIIRDEPALGAIRRYIADNPLRWHLDHYNPNAIAPDPLARDIWQMIRAAEAISRPQTIPEDSHEP